MTAQPHGLVLVVAGSDPSAGAGLQADLKTVAGMGGYAMTAVTAITVQDTRLVHQVYPVPAEWVAQQMRACLADMGVGCIKLGMLATREIVLAVAEVLAEWPDIPVVADPVLAGSGGGTLLDEKGRQAFLAELVPLLTLLTPNLPEAQIFSGVVIESVADMERAARCLAALPHKKRAGGMAILVTGGHLPGSHLTDLLYDTGNVSHFQTQRLLGMEFHGTGCALASAIATGLAQGKDLHAAVTSALAFVQRALAASFALGAGQRLLHLLPTPCPHASTTIFNQGQGAHDGCLPK